MKDLTSGNIHKNFFLFTIPVVLSSLLSVAAGIIDTSIAGLFLGSRGLAATGATTSFFLLFEAIFFGISYGVTTATAKLFGAKQYSRLKSVFYSNALLIVGATSCLAILFIPLWRPVFSFLNVDPLITSEAHQYYICLCLYLVPAMVNHYCNLIFNSIGESKIPLYITVLISILNIFGNLASVTVLNLGVLGLGLSTVISSSIGSVLFLKHFHSCCKKMNVSKERYRFRWEHITSLLSYSIPNIIQQSAMYFIGLLVSPLINGLGYIAIAVNSITGRLHSINSNIYYASARTAANYISQCVGAKKYRKIRSSLGVAMLQACIFFVPIVIFMWCFPSLICHIFVDSEAEASVTYYVTVYLRYYLPFVVLNMVCGVFHSVFRAIKSNAHLIVSTGLSSVAKLVACYFFIPVYGIPGIFLSTVVSWCIELLYIGVVFFSGLWVPKSIRKEVLHPKKEPEEEKDRTLLSV